MSSIGPSLPPHLAPKRKRDDSNSDDDFGPAPPKQRSRSSSSSSDNGDKRRRVVGPSLPSTTTATNAPSPKSIGPSLPPTASPNRPSPKVKGPLLPPAPLSERPTTDPNSGSESDSDDDFGPAPPPTAGTAAYESERLRQRNYDVETTATQEPTNAPQREEWMLAPPSGLDWGSRVDPTKLKNRKFNTGKGAKGPKQGGGDADSRLWTETPEQKRKRLEDEMMGVKRPAGVEGEKGRGKGREELETERRIREHNEKNRNVSLYEQHRVRGPKEEEDDPSARAFDREKDIGGGMKINHTKRKELLNKAADFGSRFSKGNYL